jgi:hypothetical protein
MNRESVMGIGGVQGRGIFDGKLRDEKVYREI